MTEEEEILHWAATQEILKREKASLDHLNTYLKVHERQLRRMNWSWAWKDKWKPRAQRLGLLAGGVVGVVWLPLWTFRAVDRAFGVSARLLPADRALPWLWGVVLLLAGAVTLVGAWCTLRWLWYGGSQKRARPSQKNQDY